MAWRRRRAGGVQGGARQVDLQACTACGGRAVVDFVDLVARSGSLHCSDCGHLWSVEHLAVPLPR